jgi:SAM-dependent methyltransferase
MNLSRWRNELVKQTAPVIDAFNRTRRTRTHHCPVCVRDTAFAPAIAPTGMRRWARCPHCHAMERHRLQAWVIEDRLAPQFRTQQPRILHIAPEASVRALLQPWAGTYTTADFDMPGVDVHIDLRDTNLETASFDIVYASHVLEHIDRDRDAIAEIRRILAPGGVAVLPVPLIGEHTIEYPAPNPVEEFHVRAPGYDYYDRYHDFFARVDVISSADAPERIQPYIHEDRSKWPTRSMPWRVASEGRRHADAVPLCWA